MSACTWVPPYASFDKAREALHWFPMGKYVHNGMNVIKIVDDGRENIAGIDGDGWEYFTDYTMHSPKGDTVAWSVETGGTSEFWRCGEQGAPAQRCGDAGKLQLPNCRQLAMNFGFVRHRFGWCGPAQNGRPPFPGRPQDCWVHCASVWVPKEAPNGFELDGEKFSERHRII